MLKAIYSSRLSKITLIAYLLGYIPYIVVAGFIWERFWGQPILGLIYVLSPFVIFGVWVLLFLYTMLYNIVRYNKFRFAMPWDEDFHKED